MILIKQMISICKVASKVMFAGTINTMVQQYKNKQIFLLSFFINIR